MSLVKTLVDQLGVSTEQAQGGAGMLFNIAKSKLSGDEYSQLSNQIPESGQLAAKAPAPSGVSAVLGKVGALVGGKGESYGQMSELASGFSQLGMSKDMIQKFVPTVLNYVQEYGGDNARALLDKVIATGN